MTQISQELHVTNSLVYITPQRCNPIGVYTLISTTMVDVITSLQPHLKMVSNNTEIDKMTKQKYSLLTEIYRGKKATKLT